MRTVRSILVLLASALVLGHVSKLAAQPAAVVSREYRLKAGVLVNLGQSVSWPKEAAPTDDKPLTIGILGGDTFFEGGVNQLDAAVAAAKAKGVKLAVLRFDSVKDYKPCHILFLSSESTPRSLEKTLAERLRGVQKATEGASVLLVGESGGLSTQGVVANLVFDPATNLIRLEVNPDAAHRAGLKISPGLLRLAQIVRDK